MCQGCCRGLAGDEVDDGSSSVTALEKNCPHHLQLNSTLVFSVSVVEAADVSPIYSEVFCQFKYSVLVHVSSVMLCFFDR